LNLEVQQATPANTPANGAIVQISSLALDEKTQKFWRSKSTAANFAGAFSFLMRRPAHKHNTLTGLEWRLLPPLILNQFIGCRSKAAKRAGHAWRLVLWARPGRDRCTADGFAALPNPAASAWEKCPPGARKQEQR
jgi:hypothetical protein